MKPINIFDKIKMNHTLKHNKFLGCSRMFSSDNDPNKEIVYPLRRSLPKNNEKYEIFQKAYPMKMSWVEKLKSDEGGIKAHEQTRLDKKFGFKKNTELVKYLKTCGKMSRTLDDQKELQIKYTFKGENQSLRIPKLTNNVISMSPTKFRHDFFKFGNKQILSDCLKKHGIVEASKIQCKAIPLMLTGNHLFISSLSGSGKTLAYLIPLVDKILTYNMKYKINDSPNNEDSNANMKAKDDSSKTFHEMAAEQMLSDFDYTAHSNPIAPFIVILVPTIILANQIKRNINEMFGELGIKAISRDDIYKKSGSVNEASFFVTTPPSCLTCFGKFEMKTVHSVVLDEADVLMKDFSDYLDSFIKMPKICEKFGKDNLPFIFTSASLPEDNGIVFLETYFPLIKFVTQHHHIMAPNIEYRFQRVDQNKVFEQLLTDVNNSLRDERVVLIFAISNKKAREIHTFLTENQIKSLLITADEPNIQNELSSIGKEYKIVVTSDICSRGIHLDTVDTIINFNFPKHPTNFLHRIGRTARLGGHYQRHPLVYSYIVRRCDVFIANIIIQNYKATGGAIYNLPQYTL